MDYNPEDAKDALNNAGLKAWQYFCKHNREVTNLKAWITRILYNQCMSIQKERQRQLQYVSRPATADQKAAISLIPTPLSAEKLLLLGETKQYVRSSINALPAHLREPVILYFFQDMSPHDIAVRLHISPDNVRKRLQLARAKLRQYLTAYINGEPVSLREDANADSSFSSLAPQKYAREQHNQDMIPDQILAIRAVRLTSPNGAERLVYLALDHKPARQRQKLNTLLTYVKRHPTGWRKRVQLAHLLYAIGQWQEAIAAYRYVLQRQPCHLEARLRLGYMLRLLRRKDEAATIYQESLELAGSKATQHHLEGCLAACHRRREDAARAYAAAATAEPHNAAHWCALGLTKLHAGRRGDALQDFEAALDVHPNHLVALTYSYFPLAATGRMETALSRLEQALEIDPKNHLALTQLAKQRRRV